MENVRLEEFIERAKAVHGDKYDYSKVEYINCDTKVCIICPEHGEFWQIPYSHTVGNGCPECGRIKSNKSRSLDNSFFITKAKTIHGDRYDYSKVEYINNRAKLCIICPEHGEFWQSAGSHLNGSGCPECANVKKKNRYNLSTEEFIERAKATHGNKYDYSKVIYKNAKTKVCIICPEHGEFWQEAYSHIVGNGCPDCAIEIKSQKKKLSTEEFIENAKSIHCNKYDYSKTEYTTAKEPVTIICPVHGEFQQTPDAHMHGSGCQKCGNSISEPENEIYEYLSNELNVNVERHNRNILKPLEIDLYLPKINIGIEYNGLYWHSEKFKNDNYHLLKKTLKSKENGISLIHIFEDEWINKRDIVLSKIKHLCSLNNSPKIFGRKTIVRKIDKHVGREFLEKFHIQGDGISSLYYGAFYNDKLIAVISFKKDGENKWELTRFASDYNYICCGVGGKLFKHFVKQHNPSEVKSFADRRWTIDEENNLYVQLGFEFDGYIRPDYKYIINGKYLRLHKFNFRKKDLLKQYGEKYDLNEHMTEKEMAKKIGLLRIYDCGLIKYIWRKEK